MSKETRIRQHADPRITIGPRVRKSPYFDATLRWGAKAFTVYNHVYMPTHYGDPVAEYWSLVNDVTLWDVSCQRQIRISGPDARPFMELLTPRDLSGCPSHQCLYVLLTDQHGGIVNDAVLMHLRENEFWLSPGDGDVVLWAQGVASLSGMDVEVVESDINPLQLQGPKSAHVAYKLFGDAALDLGYYHVVETELDGIPLALSRTGWSGELGYEIYLHDRVHGEWLWETIMQAGRGIRHHPGGAEYDPQHRGRPAVLRFRHPPRGQPLHAGPRPPGAAWTSRPTFSGAKRCAESTPRATIAGWSASRSTASRSPATNRSGQYWNPARSWATSAAACSRLGWSATSASPTCPPRIPSSGTPLTIDVPGGQRPAAVVKAPWFPAQKDIPTDIRT